MSAQVENPERRTETRYRCNVNVYAQDEAARLGYAIDLSVEGMLLVTEQPLKLQQRYQLTFGGDKYADNTNLIRIDACPAWSEDDDSKGLHYTGMRFTELTPASLQHLNQILFELKESSMARTAGVRGHVQSHPL